MVIQSEKMNDFLGNTDSTLKQSMALIDRNKKGIIFIINSERQLIGSLSDGDIRRALLTGWDLDASVEEFMNPDPFFIFSGDERGLDISLLDAKGYKLIPVCDSQKHILSLISNSGLEVNPPLPNPVVLMVGGRGIRLEPLTQQVPKPLLKVGNKPILQTILERLHLFGFRNIYLCTNYLSDSIKEFCGDGSKFGLHIRYFIETKKLGTIGAVKHFQEELKLPFLVMNGDLLTLLNYKNVLDFHIENNADLTIGTATYTAQVPYGVLETEGNKVKAIVEKPEYIYRISGGVYALQPQILEFIPENQYFDITDLMEILIQRNMEMVSYPIEDYWLDIGQHQDFEKANKDYDNLFN